MWQYLQAVLLILKPAESRQLVPHPYLGDSDTRALPRKPNESVRLTLLIKEPIHPPVSLEN